MRRLQSTTPLNRPGILTGPVSLIGQTVVLRRLPTAADAARSRAVFGWPRLAWRRMAT
jgi:hypothetical protein